MRRTFVFVSYSRHFFSSVLDSHRKFNSTDVLKVEYLFMRGRRTWQILGKLEVAFISILEPLWLLCYVPSPGAERHDSYCSRHFESASCGVTSPMQGSESDTFPLCARTGPVVVEAMSPEMGLKA